MRWPLTEVHLQAVRTAIRQWQQPVPGKPGPRHTGDLADIIDLMLATGARIGEILALRWEDLDLAAERPTLTSCGTLVYVKGKGLFRQEQVGLTEAYGEALPAQLALIQYALGDDTAPVRRTLAVYIASNHRNKYLPPIAQQMLDRTNPQLEHALSALAADIRAAGSVPDIAALADVVTGAYRRVGIPAARRRGPERPTEPATRFGCSTLTTDWQRWKSSCYVAATTRWSVV